MLLGQRNTADTELPVLSRKKMKKKTRGSRRRRTTMKCRRRYGLHRATDVL